MILKNKQNTAKRAKLPFLFYHHRYMQGHHITISSTFLNK